MNPGKLGKMRRCCICADFASRGPGAHRYEQLASALQARDLSFKHLRTRDYPADQQSPYPSSPPSSPRSIKPRISPSLASAPSEHLQREQQDTQASKRSRTARAFDGAPLRHVDVLASLAVSGPVVDPRLQQPLHGTTGLQQRAALANQK